MSNTPPALPALLNIFHRERITANAWAIQHGIDPSEFSKILRGKRKRISVEFAALIEDATNGEVTMRMWL